MPSSSLSRISKRKNPAAVKLAAAKLGALGGKARARNLLKRELSKIGRKGAAARWKKAKK